MSIALDEFLFILTILSELKSNYSFWVKNEIPVTKQSVFKNYKMFSSSTSVHQ